MATDVGFVDAFKSRTNLTLKLPTNIKNETLEKASAQLTKIFNPKSTLVNIVKSQVLLSSLLSNINQQPQESTNLIDVLLQSEFFDQNVRYDFQKTTNNSIEFIANINRPVASTKTTPSASDSRQVQKPSPGSVSSSSNVLPNSPSNPPDPLPRSSGKKNFIAIGLIFTVITALIVTLTLHKPFRNKCQNLAIRTLQTLKIIWEKYFSRSQRESKGKTSLSTIAKMPTTPIQISSGPQPIHTPNTLKTVNKI